MKKGFSLPLWVTGAAKSAVKKLIGLPFEDYELIKIPKDKNLIKIKVHSSGLINGESNALGISFADSGLHLTGKEWSDSLETPVSSCSLAAIPLEGVESTRLCKPERLA